MKDIGMPLQTVLAHFDAPILLIHPLSAGKLGVITSDHQIYLYDTLTQEKEKIVRLNVAQEATLHYAFDPHHMRLIFGMENTHKLHLIDLKKKNSSTVLTSTGNPLPPSRIRRMAVISSAGPIRDASSYGGRIPTP